MKTLAQQRLSHLLARRRSLRAHGQTRSAAAKRYPNHTPAQKCNNCSFWQAGAADAWGGCAMFGRKHVNAVGRRTAWAKKPG